MGMEAFSYFFTLISGGLKSDNHIKYVSQAIQQSAPIFGPRISFISESYQTKGKAILREIVSKDVENSSIIYPCKQDLKSNHGT